MSSSTAAFISDISSKAAEGKQATWAPSTSIDPIANTESDEDLLLKIGKEDKAALTLLFQRHARKVLHVARRILHDDCEAEDLMQDLFVFIFQRAKLFDPQKASAASWIIQMAYHRAIDRRRYLASRHHYRSEEIRDDWQETTRGQISIDELSGKVLLEKLRKELSGEQLEVLELHFFEGYTFHEIAERTGKVFGNVRHHYYRGIERLRAHVFPGKTDLK